MERALARLADAVSRRRRLILGAWLVLVLASAWFSLHQTDKLSGGGWDVPGSEADRGTELLDGFPAYDGIRLAVLVESASPEEVEPALDRARDRLGALDGIRAVGDPIVGEGGRGALLPVRWSEELSDDDVFDFATDLRRAVVSDTDGTSTRVIGEPAIWSNFQEVSKEQLARAEIIGFPLVFVVLLAAFGTLVAAAMPIVLGLVAVTVTGAAIWWLGGVAEMSIYVTNMATMIGIGVSVDYSLFVVSRYRRELRAGLSEGGALRRALASSGTAVVFSGATVVVSLSSLFLVNMNAVRSMAAGAIIVVSVAVLATVTLLPALLARLGSRVDRLEVPFLGRRGEEGGPFWISWSQRVMRRPALFLACGTAFMLLLASPVIALHTENRGLNQLPPDAEVRAATERGAVLAGPGLSEPIHVFASDEATALEIRSGLAERPDVAEAERPVRSEDGRWELVETMLAVDPGSRAGRNAYLAAHDIAERAAAARDAEVVLGGATAWNLAIEEALAGGLWRIVLFILAVSYVVLLLLLRSVLLPLKAVFMNLLSVLAAYGVLVAVFEWGWLDWTGYDSPGYVDAIVPALVLATTFGLSMDYEVFLLTRIRERYATGISNEQAVAEGLASSARVITAAALIMVVVFGAFAIAGAPSLKELGLGLAVAIALDATVVRLVLVPAAMRLLGDWNWWFPGRILAHRPGGASFGGQ